MTYQTNTKSLGFRELIPAELCAVSGGRDEAVGKGFTVNGRRQTWSPSGDGAGGLGSGLSSFQFMDFSLLQSIDLEKLEDFFSKWIAQNPNASSEEIEDFTKKTLELIGADLKDFVKKYGDFKIEFSNGLSFKASSLVKGFEFLGNADLVVEGVALTNDYFEGDLNAVEALGFLGALAVTAGLTFYGAPAIVVVLAALAAEKGIEAVADGSAEALYQQIMGLFDWSDLEQWHNNMNFAPNQTQFEFWKNFSPNGVDWSEP
jgi:hypothetical protein